MTTYKLSVVNGDAETVLEFTEKLIGVEWKCAGGDAVWGTPSSGTTLGPLMTGGIIQLSPLNDTLEGVNLSKKGKQGTGSHVDKKGGSFPAGDFDWKVI